MSCPKCETGLMVIETVTTGGFQFEQWRCVNCGKRMNEEEYMGWTEEQRKQHSERMKKNWDQRPRGPKKFKRVALTLDEMGDIEEIQLPEKFSELTPLTDEAEEIHAMLDGRSPAVIEIDVVIADMEEDIRRIGYELSQLRSVRARLVQRQGS